MVIVVMGEASTAVARELASVLGWALIEEPLGTAAAGGATRVERALDRREHAVAASPPLTLPQRERVRGDRHGVRFVLLQSNGAAAMYQPDADGTVVLNAALMPPQVVSAVREEFGV